MSPERRIDLTEASVINSPEVAHQELERYFVQPESRVFVDRWLREMACFRQQFPCTHNTFLRKSATQGPLDLSVLEIISGSSVKLGWIRDAISETGMNVAGIEVDPALEFLEGRRLKTEGVSPEDYPLSLGSWKINEREAVLSGVPRRSMIAMDTIAIGQNGIIIEKPKSREEAVASLQNYSGSIIKVVTGIHMVLETERRWSLGVDDKVTMSLKFRELSKEEIEKALNLMGDRMFKVTAGVDLASPVGKSLIDPNFPIEVSSCSCIEGFDRGVVCLDKEALSAVDSYFQGAPIHLIRSMVRQIEPIYKELGEIK